jgi:myo-inositol-1(or 4)-monophosphatase
MIDSSRIDEAIIFAVKAHANAARKGTNIPYILHPIEAAVIVASITDDPDVIAAAVLHDVLEDTDVTPEQLEFEFGSCVLKLVQTESEDKREEKPAGETWELRKQESIDLLKAEDDDNVKIIALGDKLSNIRSIYRDYTTLGDSFWGRFNQKDKYKHCWYYASIRDALSNLKEYPAWQEYSSLVDKVFQYAENS